MDEEVVEIIERCKVDIGYHLKMFHPERFERPFSRSHEQVFEAINDKKLQKILVVAHRGWGKTSVFNFGVPSQYIAFHGNPKGGFVVPVAATAALSILQSENLKRELMSNPFYRTIVGDIKTDDTFSKEAWVTSTDALVMPRAVEQQVRGLLYKNARPQLILPDDLENLERVQSSEQREKLENWFMTDLSNCVDRSSNDWRILMVGTVLHQSSLLSMIRDDSTWTVFNLPLCDEQYKSYWTEFRTDEQCRTIADEYRNRHKIEQFYMEYMNVVNPGEDAAFRIEMFKYYTEDDPDIDWSSDELDHIVIVDPAKTEKVHNDYTAIVGITLDTVRNRIYFRDIINSHLYPDQIYKETFDMADRLNARVIGFEVTGLSEFIRQPMHDAMFARGKVYDLVELKARSSSGGTYAAKGTSKGKLARISQLVPYYRMGWIYHNPACCAALELQLLEFPYSKHDDIMDACAYVIEMMELGDRFMSEATEELQYKELNKSIESEYDALQAEDEEAVDDWAYLEA